MDAPVALPTAADVDEAARRLAGVALHTPLLTSIALDAMTGGRTFLKAETLQRTGSFKFRGAYNKLAAIPPEQRAGGVVAYSSGNHAQGVAAAARLLGMRCVIVMPRDAPRAKRERTAAHGADVVLYDRARDDREAIASEIAAKRGAILVPPYDDALIIAGQGTAGREIIEDLARNGAFARHRGGHCVRRRPHRGHRACRQGARPRQRNSTPPSRKGSTITRDRSAADSREENAALTGTICDALMARMPGKLTFAINQSLVSAGLAVSDAEVAAAVAFAFNELKLVVEPGGAVALAALMHGKIDVKDKVAVAVLSGGNVDPGSIFAPRRITQPANRTKRSTHPRSGRAWRRADRSPGGARGASRTSQLAAAVADLLRPAQRSG